MTQKVYVVGLGPGGIEQMTQRAKAALESCDVIAGYHVYIDLIKNDFTGKEFLTTGMRKEVDRCKLAIEEALKGKTVAMISSGDAGVYGMAGIMYQVQYRLQQQLRLLHSNCILMKLYCRYWPPILLNARKHYLRLQLISQNQNY